MNYKMPCLITALKKSAITKTTGCKKKRTTKQQNNHHKKSTSKLSNNVKIQPDKNLTTQFYFFVTTKQLRIHIKETV